MLFDILMLEDTWVVLDELVNLWKVLANLSRINSVEKFMYVQIAVLSKVSDSVVIADNGTNALQSLCHFGLVINNKTMMSYRHNGQHQINQTQAYPHSKQLQLPSIAIPPIF